MNVMITGKIVDSNGKHYTRTEVAKLLAEYNKTHSDQILLTQSKTSNTYRYLDVLVVGDTGIHGYTDRTQKVDQINKMRMVSVNKITKINSEVFLGMIFEGKKISVDIINELLSQKGVTVDISI